MSMGASMTEVTDAAALRVLTAAEGEEILHDAEHYELPRAASIEALKLVQRRMGWVNNDAMADIAGLLGMSVAELEEVATFYNLIYRQPVGRHVIKYCDSVSCHLMDQEGLTAKLEAKLGVKAGQTTADGRFTLLPICCLGACDRGPCLMVGDDLHGPLPPDDDARIDAMLESYP